MAETFLKGDDVINNVHGYRWLGKNRVTKGGGGIGAFISNDVDILDDNVFNSVSDVYERFWFKTCINYDKPMYIAVAYFPVEGSDNDKCDELYNQLLSEVIRIEDEHVDENPQILIMSDMNARIGKEIPNGDPVLNSNGKRLLDFRDDSNLNILNCNRLCVGKYTWFRGNSRSTIDYMLCTNNIVDHVKEFIVDEDRHMGLGSDHNVLLLKMSCNRIKQGERNSGRIKKYIWDIKKDQDFTPFQDQLNVQFRDWDANSFDDANCLWDSWKEKLIAAACEGLGVREIKGNQKRNPWFDNSVDTAIKERREAARKHRKWVKGNNVDDNGEDLWKLYQDKRIHAKNLIRSKITETRMNKSVDLARKGGRNCRDFWKTLKGDKQNKADVYCLKVPDSDEVTSDRKKMNQTVLQYWRTLGKMNRSLNDEDDEHTIYTRELVNRIRKNNLETHQDSVNENILSDIHINLDIIKDAISSSKNNKSPGTDMITNEILKNGGECLDKSILSLFNRIICLEKIPSEWNKGIIVPIFKKGDRRDLNNYRGISLTSCVSKIFNRIIANTISSFLEQDNILSEVQGGFRSSRRCEDHIFTLKSIAACRLAEGKKTFLAFLDFRKAFDTVWREGLLRAAWDIGIRGRIWRVIDNLYEKVQGRVRLGQIETDFFDIDEGVKQGCVLSPVLFCIFMHEFTKLLKERDLGVRIHDVCMGSLFWADDVVLLANDESELNKLLGLAADFAKTWKLDFNHEKSNVLIIGQRINNDKVWKLGEHYISEVDSYKYLGVHISRSLSDHVHVEQTVKKGNRLIAYIKSIIDNFDDFNRVYYGDILWKTIALPTINYACAIWVDSSKQDTDKIENLQLQMARYILKASRNTPKEALYGDLGWVPIKVSQDALRVKYLNHLLSMDKHRWSNLMLNTILNFSGADRLRYKFLSNIQKTCADCNFDIGNILDNARIGDVPNTSQWVTSFNFAINDNYVQFWHDEIGRKSSLKEYAAVKCRPGLENYLLDKTDFQGASLKFRLRSNTLPLDRRTSNWSPAHDSTCKTCNNGIENVHHFLFTCAALNDIRIEEYIKLERKLISMNYINVWELFMSSNLDVKLNLTLGSVECVNADKPDDDNLIIIFDDFCKSYTKRAWKLRTNLRN